MTGIEVLSDNWYTLRKATFDFQGPDGRWRTEQREAYDRGNGATVLLHDPDRGTIVLTRQFRLPGLSQRAPRRHVGRGARRAARRRRHR